MKTTAAEAVTGALVTPVPVGLERGRDLDEERDLDRELQTELSLAEESD